MRAGIALMAVLPLLWLLASPVAADHGGAHRYVNAATGNDTNSCTEAEPCASIARAIVVAAASDVIEIAPGVYEENDGLHANTALRITKDVTLRGAGDGSTFIQPAAGNNHRVIYLNFNRTATIERVTIRNGLIPVDEDGAGILSRGTLHLDRSTVTNNRVSGDGSGGGLAFPEGGISTITNSTISGNRATRGAGGVFVTQGDFDWPTVVIRNTTIANNTSDDDDGHGLMRSGGTLTLHNTIVANGDADNCSGVFTASNSNIATDGTCDSATAVTQAELNLGALAANGGPTQTHALLAGSAAIDHEHIDAGECPSTDQRGESRPQGERCDAGAFEFVPVVASDDATLSDIAVSAGVLSPAFDTATTAYTVDATHETASTTVTPTANDDDATITVDATAVDSGVASDSIALAVGDTTITIVVTAEDGTTTETYTITVTRADAPPPPPPPPPPPAPAPTLIETSGQINLPITGLEQTPITPGESATVSLTNSDGTQVTVTIPAGALPDPAEGDDPALTLEVASVEDMEAVQDQAPGPPGASIVAAFIVRLADGQGHNVSRTFAEPATIEFSIPASQIPDSASTDTLFIAYWNGTEWQLVESTAVINHDGSATVVVEVTHFTLFSTLSLPEAGRFSAPIADSGITLASWGGGTLNTLLTALLGDASEGKRLWVHLDGRWLGYLPGGPDIVNSTFLQAHPNGLQPGTPVAIIR